MSDQDVKNVAQNAVEQTKAVGDQAKGLARDAATIVADAAEAAKNAASRGVAAAQGAGEAAQVVARQAAQQSVEARDFLIRTVEQNPLVSLLVAGAVGYGLACMVRNR